MPTLADLKAQHPEWCWKCGDRFQPTGTHHGGLACPYMELPILAALIAKALEDEAKLAESEAKVKELLENRIPFAEVIVELWEWADKVMTESEARGFSDSANLCITEETHSVYANAVGILGAAREEARKKGSEHGE